MKSVSKKEIHGVLRRAGLKKGQAVYIQSRLSAIGPVAGAGTKEDFCGAYLDCVLDIVGPSGTVIVPTYTTQVARFNMDFVWEETPSLMGIFTEFVRGRRGALRSLHPIHSVCALGADKEFICRDNGLSNFGWDSPFHRMLLRKAKILTIGLESGYVVALAHHLEAAGSLPYVYNKLLKWSPIVKGKRDPRPWFATSRYLDLDVQYDLSRWVRCVRALGQVGSAPLGGGWVHLSDYERVFREGMKALRKDPFYFLKAPPAFTPGRLPFDAATAGRDNIAGKEERKRLASVNWAGYYLLNTDHAGGDDDEL